LAEFAPLAKSQDKSAAYQMQVGRANLVVGQWVDAVRAAQAAGRLVPRSPQPYALLGAVYIARGDLAKAHEMYAHAVEVDPKFASGHLALGRVNQLDKKPEEALKDYDEALKIDPGHYPSIAAKAETLVQQKQMPRAIAFVEAAQKADP